MKTRRKRIDGAAGLQQVIADAALPPIPPPDYIHLTDNERLYWNDLFSSKARRAWLTQDLLALADLCRARTKIENLELALADLSPVDDLPIFEKLEKLLDLAVKRYRLLAVYLQVHPEATQGKSMKQVQQNQAHTVAVGVSQSNDDGLIPRAMH